MALSKSNIQPPTLDAPGPNWIAIGKAHYYCSGGSFQPSEKGWASALLYDLKRILEQKRSESPKLLPDYELEMVFHGVGINALGLTTVIWPEGSIDVTATGRPPEATWTLRFGWYPNLLRIFDDDKWGEVPSSDRVAASVHRYVLEYLVQIWHRYFTTSLATGAARIFARRSVLSHFEQISVDQWQYFEMDEPLRRSDPFGSQAGRYELSSATGPGGARLFSIYVALGASAHGSKQSMVEQCEQWLVGLLQRFPGSPPKKRAELAEEALAKFPGLKKRGFERCMAHAIRVTGNYNWTKAGRPRKISAK